MAIKQTFWFFASFAIQAVKSIRSPEEIRVDWVFKRKYPKLSPNRSFGDKVNLITHKEHVNGVFVSSDLRGFLNTLDNIKKLEERWTVMDVQKTGHIYNSEF